MFLFELKIRITPIVYMDSKGKRSGYRLKLNRIDLCCTGFQLWPEVCLPHRNMRLKGHCIMWTMQIPACIDPMTYLLTSENNNLCLNLAIFGGKIYVSVVIACVVVISIHIIITCRYFIHNYAACYCFVHILLLAVVISCMYYQL